MTEDPEILAKRPRKRKTTILVVVVVLLVMPVVAFYWMYPTWESQKGFDVPKITIAHIDNEPFMRLQLGPGQSYRPIEIMAGTRVIAECEVVSLQSSRHFLIRSFGKTIELNDCNFIVEVPSEIGRTDTFVFEYRDGEVDEVTDMMEVPVIVVPHGERLEFQALEDTEGHKIADGSVPQRVVVYARAIMEDLQNYRDLVPLFFVADSVSGIPVLQLNPERESDEQPSPLTGQFVRYRRYGEKLAGYALWSRAELIVGDHDDKRTVFDIHYGIFPKSSIDEVLRKTLSIRWTGTDSITVTPLIGSLKELRAMTYRGRYLSPPLHVVRGTVPVDMGGSIN